MVRYALPLRYLLLRYLVELCIIIAIAPVVVGIGFVAALAIYIESGKPIFFRQLRPNHRGTFSIWKFRTMHYDNSPKQQLTAAADPRITKVGRIIRKYHIDEIPQLWNVIRGDLSLVGPRPEPLWLAHELEACIPEYWCRRLVPPGITGLAQVYQGYTTSVEEAFVKLDYDLYYIMHLSAQLDLYILFETIRVVVTSRGVR